MKGFKPFGKHMKSGFSFPTKAGFTASSGKVQEVGSYSRRTPTRRKFADGGRVPGMGAASDKDTALVVKSRATPGFGGAIKDLVKSVSEAVAPKSVKDRGKVLEKAEASYADGGSVGNAAVKREHPVTETEKHYGGRGPLTSGYRKGGRAFNNKPMVGDCD